MNLGRCPVCRSHLDIQMMDVDEAGRELHALLAKMPSQLAGPLLSYLGLFRPAKQDLTNRRTVKLAQEVMALTSDHYLLGAAMAETVQQIHSNRQAGGEYSPLKNHNYLKKVLKGISERIGQAVPVSSNAEEKTEPPEQADQTEAWKRQMRKLGQDPDKILSQFQVQEDDQ